jgi:predicted PurR-regulated permease PerM
MRPVRARAEDVVRQAATANRSRATALIAVILLVGALYVARYVLIPFALAVLLTFVLSPMVTRAQRWGLRRGAAVAVAVAISLAGVGGVGWLVASQASGLAADLPSYRENIVARVRKVRTALGGPFGEARETIREIRKEIAAPSPTQPTTATGEGGSAAAKPATPVPDGQDTASQGGAGHPPSWTWGGGLLGLGPAEKPEPVPLPVRIEPREGNIIDTFTVVLGPLVGPLASLGIATVFVIFMLLQKEELRDRFIRVVGRGELSVTTNALDDAARRVSRYLAVQVIVNALTGTAIAIGLTLIGVPRAPLWGLMAALLRFVPIVGSWIAAVVPILLSLAVFDDWLRPILVVGLFSTIDLSVANVLEPALYGTRTGVAPIALFASMVFWTWLWGGIGLFLATPLTVCLVVIGRHVPQLELLSVLLGDARGAAAARHDARYEVTAPPPEPRT